MSVRFLIRDLGLSKLRNVWSRSVNVSNVVKRYRRDRSVRGVFLYFRQTFFRPRGTILLSATAACKGNDEVIEDEKVELPSCSQDITDDELESLLAAFDGIEELSQTIFCPTCNKRVMIDRRLSTIKYCTCKEASTPTISEDGWEPYVEAEDTIIWRKEYKVGQGLFAYRVYGRYKEVLASDYAAVNIDTEYRKQWDTAVADLSIVERSPTVAGQAVIHWEVLWPRLFANRDYVYLRRHKEYIVHTVPHNPLEERPSPTEKAKATDISNQNPVIYIMLPENAEGSPIKVKIETCPPPPCEDKSVPESQQALKVSTKEQVTEAKSEAEAPVPKVVSKPPETEAVPKPAPIVEPERPSVHSNAKRKSLEEYSKMKPEPQSKDNKVYVILSKSCAHPKVPETRNAIRVTEYWSQMVVRSIDGTNNAGMEFVLTYYDEPAVGGLPSGVSSWASGRAAPAYLDKMRDAAKQYDAYRLENGLAAGEPDGHLPKPVSFRDSKPAFFNEQDMESSKQGPELELDKDEMSKRDKSKKHRKHEPHSLNEDADKKLTKSEATQTELIKHVSAKSPENEIQEKADSKRIDANQDSSEDSEDTGNAGETKSSWWPNPFQFLN